MMIYSLQMAKRINFDIDEQEHREFKAKVALEGKTIAEKITEWIRKFLRGDKK